MRNSSREPLTKQGRHQTPLEILARNQNWQIGRLRGLRRYLNPITDPECYRQATEAIDRQINIKLREHAHERDQLREQMAADALRGP